MIFQADNFQQTNDFFFFFLHNSTMNEFIRLFFGGIVGLKNHRFSDTSDYIFF